MLGLVADVVDELVVGQVKVPPLPELDETFGGLLPQRPMVPQYCAGGQGGGDGAPMIASTATTVSVRPVTIVVAVGVVAVRSIAPLFTAVHVHAIDIFVVAIRVRTTT